MPIPDTSVKHIHNGMRGAPAISGTPGTLIAALDALLITGWGIVNPTSVTVADGIATATVASGDSFDAHSVVLIDGATPSSLNGEARVLTSGSTSLTWVTEAPDGAATGSITIRYAPQAAWQKVYAGTNKAAYRSNSVLSAGHFLRVDDAGTTTARVRGFESMTDVDSGSGPFPLDSMMSGGGYLHKSTAASGAAVRYKIFCDDRFVIFSIAAASHNSATLLSAPARGFGDPIALAPDGDPWGTILSFNGSGSSNVGYASLVNSNAGGVAGQIVCPRAVTGLGGAVNLINNPYTQGGAGAHSGADTTLGAFPSEVDGQLKVTPVYTRENVAGKPPRAQFPGVLYIPQSGAYGPLADGDLVVGSGDLGGRRLMVVADPSNNAWTNVPSACYLVDITGPWR